MQRPRCYTCCVGKPTMRSVPIFVLAALQSRPMWPSFCWGCLHPSGEVSYVCTYIAACMCARVRTWTRECCSYVIINAYAPCVHVSGLHCSSASGMVIVKGHAMCLHAHGLQPTMHINSTSLSPSSDSANRQVELAHACIIKNRERCMADTLTAVRTCAGIVRPLFAIIFGECIAAACCRSTCTRLLECCTE